MTEQDKRAQELAGGGIKEIVPYPCIVKQTEDEYFWSFDEMPFAYGMIAKRTDTEALKEAERKENMVMTIGEMHAQLEKQKAAEEAAKPLRRKTVRRTPPTRVNRRSRGRRNNWIG